MNAIHSKDAKLNKTKQAMLDRILDVGDYEKFRKNHVSIEDLAYLTAATDCEFALLEGKTDDILYHGEKYRCCFDETLSD